MLTVIAVNIRFDDLEAHAVGLFGVVLGFVDFMSNGWIVAQHGRPPIKTFGLEN
jgi:hypothetical protein